MDHVIVVARSCYPKTGVTSWILSLTVVAFICLSELSPVTGRVPRAGIFNCTTPFGQFADPNSCESYWICNNNLSIAATCSFGLIYSHKTQNCDWPNPEVCRRIEGKIVRDWTPPPPPALANNFHPSDSAQNNFLDADLGAEVPTRMLNAEQILNKWKKKSQQSTLPGMPMYDFTTTSTRPPPITGPPDYKLPKSFTAAPRKTYTRVPLSGQPLPCNDKNCQLPDCYCHAKKIPGGLSRQQTPQMVMVTFDDAANNGNVDLLDVLFSKNHTNPNGCPITGTFFLANPSTDYNVVRKWAQDGHEIASHSLSHKDFSQYTEKQWQGEIVGEAELAQQLGGVDAADIIGMRAPFLATGGNTMFKMLWDNEFIYDSSIPSSQLNPPLWPYTLDCPLPQKCYSNCPTGYFPGLWEVPMTDIVGLNDVACSMYDACTFPSQADDISDVFWSNFMKHYEGNRAPYLLSAHPAWYFNNPERLQGMINFMEKARKFDDVWFVSVKQVIQWIRYPTAVANLTNFTPWHCKRFSLSEL